MGRRTIAVTTGFLQLLYVGRLSHEQGLAVGGASRDSRHPERLAVDWLSWPWRAGYRLVMRPSAVMPFGEASTLLMPVVFGGLLDSQCELGLATAASAHVGIAVPNSRTNPTSSGRCATSATSSPCHLGSTACCMP